MTEMVLIQKLAVIALLLAFIIGCVNGYRGRVSFLDSDDGNPFVRGIVTGLVYVLWILGLSLITGLFVAAVRWLFM